MTNDEAIRILRRLQDPEPWEPKINKAGCEALDLAISALERDRWISVEERLPEQWEPVYAALRMEGRENWTIEIQCYDNYIPCPWGFIPVLENGKAEVYAWMPRPLPKPPKEET